jgi:predicted nucleic acid-binding protein
MTIVVSDTSPLNYLVRIGHVEILPRLFHSIHTTPSVIAELRHRRSPEVVREWVKNLPSWLVVRSPRLTNSFPTLGAGESDALSLAVEMRADLIFLDDLAARVVAEARGIPAAGTLGLLAQAHVRGWIEFEDALSRLRATNYRISDDAVERVRTLVLRNR